MADIRITNCHIHTFTQDHVPPNYPFWWIRPFKTWPKLVKGLAWLARWFAPEDIAEKLARLHAFQKEGGRHIRKPTYPSAERQTVSKPGSVCERF